MNAAGLTTRLRRTARSELARHLLGAAFWSLVAAVVVRAGNVVAGVIVGRTLGVEPLGVYGILQSTLVLVSGIFASGLGMAGTRFVSAHRDDDPDRAGAFLGLTLVAAGVLAGLVATVFVAFGPFLAASQLGIPGLGGAVRITGMAAALGVLAATLNAVLTGFGEYRRNAIIGSIGGVVFLAAIYPLAKAFGPGGAIAALGLQSVVFLFAGTLALRRIAPRRGVRARLAGAADHRTEFLRFAIPASLSTAVVAPATWFGNVLLVRSADGIAQMGVFSAAYQWYIIMTFVPLSLAPMMLSLLSRHRSDARRAATLRRTSFALNVALAGAAAAVLVVSAPLLFRAYGEGFAASTSPLRLLAIAAVLNALTTAAAQDIASRASMWWGTALNTLWSTVFLAVVGWQYPAVTATRLAVAYAIAYAVLVVATMGFLRHQARVDALTRDHGTVDRLVEAP